MGQKTETESAVADDPERPIMGQPGLSQSQAQQSDTATAPPGRTFTHNRPMIHEGNERFAECRRQCARVTSALQSASSEWDLGIWDSGRFEWREAAATKNAAGSAPKHRMAAYDRDVPRLSMGPK